MPRQKLSPQLTTDIESDIGEIKNYLAKVATKDDIKELKSHIDLRSEEILRAINHEQANILPEGS